MKAKRNRTLDQTGRVVAVPDADAMPGQKIVLEDWVLQEFAKMYLMSRAGLPSPGERAVEHHEPSLGKPARVLPGRYFLKVNLDWKFAGVVAIFALWILKSLVIPLLK